MFKFGLLIFLMFTSPIVPQPNPTIKELYSTPCWRDPDGVLDLPEKYLEEQYELGILEDYLVNVCTDLTLKKD